MSSESPFLLPDHLDYAEVVTDAAVHVLETHGVDRFSVSAMARWMKVSPEAVLNAYSRSRVIEVVTICFCRRFLRWSLSDLDWIKSPTCPLRLPETSVERHGIRVLRALEELAEGERVRGHPLPAQHLARLREDEAEALRSRLAQVSPVQFYQPVSEPDLRGLISLVRGLRTSLIDDPPRLTWAQACELCDRAVSSIASPGPDAPTTTSDLHPPHEPAA